MPKCILHVGLHKTGTTSIQNSLAEFADDAFFYARLGGQANHSVPIFSIFSENPQQHRLNRSRAAKPGALRQYIRGVRTALELSIAEAKNRTLIISGEGIVHLEKSELETLRDFLVGHGYDIEVLAYVRPPAATVASVFQQLLKAGRLKRLNLQRVYPNYFERIGKFDAVFGKDQVKLSKFDPSAFRDKDVVADFCARAGIDYKTVESVRMNESLTLGLCKSIYQFNSVREERGYDRLSPRAAKALDKVLGNLEPGKVQFGRELIEPLLKKNERDIRWMEERLGQSLADDTKDLSGAINSEDDLLQPVVGAEAVLRAAISAAGGGEPPANADVYALMAQHAALTAAATREGKATFGKLAAGKRGKMAKRDRPNQATSGAKSPGGRGRGEGRKAVRASDNAKDSSPAKRVRRAAVKAVPGVLKRPGGPAKGAAGPVVGFLKPMDQAIVKTVPSVPLTRTPTPMINKDKNLVVIWSPKSACTTTYVWFSHVSGFSSDVKSYAAWPHRHRIEQYQKSSLYADSANSDMSKAKTLRVMRDPYGRAVSIYRHALQTHFADKDLDVYSSGNMTAEKGYSFQAFLDFVAQLDMQRVDIHFRPQVHAYETAHKPDCVINITKQDLFTELNAFEERAGLPRTDFADLNWLHNLESKRKAKQDPMEGDALDTVDFTRQQVVKLGQFPSYDQLLTPEARQKIETIYKVDFDAYRAYL